MGGLVSTPGSWWDNSPPATNLVVPARLTQITSPPHLTCRRVYTECMPLSAHELASVEHQACRLVRDFISGSVLPVLARNVNPLSWTRYCHGLVVRADASLGSLLKLNDNGDFQAIVGCTRNLFENAIDLLLIAHQENGSFARMIAWEQSAKFKLAASRTAVPEARVFLEVNEIEVKEARQKYWNGSHPARWTGRHLGQDATKADEQSASEGRLLEGRTFSEYYRERYSMNCWYIHGSGLIGLYGPVGGHLSRVIAFARRDARAFALVSAMTSMALLKCRDDITMASVEALRHDIIALYPKG